MVDIPNLQSVVGISFTNTKQDVCTISIIQMRNKTNRCIYPVNSTIGKRKYVITSPIEKCMNCVFVRYHNIYEYKAYLGTNGIDQKTD